MLRHTASSVMVAFGWFVGLERWASAQTNVMSGDACMGQLGDTRIVYDRLDYCRRVAGQSALTAAQCMTEQHRVSDVCGWCLGQLIVCDEDCHPSCGARSPTPTPPCLACMMAYNCSADFEQCAGVDLPRRLTEEGPADDRDDHEQPEAFV
mmetsp:Transcript_125429/g.360396  ORF Transcript_125429/g.360396 Transcript_125429/m.360396 type:complete len:151 (+) Transcript_125429:87-539(+)